MCQASLWKLFWENYRHWDVLWVFKWRWACIVRWNACFKMGELREPLQVSNSLPNLGLYQLWERGWKRDWETASPFNQESALAKYLLYSIWQSLMYKIFIYNVSYTNGRKGPKHIDEMKALSLIYFRHMERFGAGTMKWFPGFLRVIFIVLWNLVVGDLSCNF